MDGESNDDGSYIEVLLEPHVNDDIPESDDFPDLMRVGGALGDAVNVTKTDLLRKNQLERRNEIRH